MKNSLVRIALLLTVMLMGVTSAFAQQVPNPRVSPTMIAAVKVDGAYIKVVYGMPFRNDRVVFGGLVPYNQVWRTGANEATEITFTRDVMFGSAEVKAGHYSLFSIPGESEWTVILSNDLGIWGTRYNAEMDYVRITVPSESLPDMWEAFRIQLANNEGNIAMTMRWEQTGVTVPIRLK
jgi:hypothetical protein